MSVKIIQGDCMTVLKTLPDNSVDAIVTDPPYGISFMGKKWDYDVPKVEVWQESLRVLKPGGHALIACGTRTQHRMAVNIEDAGFEIRDIVGWIYGSGFPKSLNIGNATDKMQGNTREPYERPDFVARSNKTEQRKSQCICGEKGKYTKGNSEWEGYGTALKPAMELWTLARKPLSEPTVAANVLKWGTGGINVDGCRVGGIDTRQVTGGATEGSGWGTKGGAIAGSELGRFPANLIHDGSDEVVKGFPDSTSGLMKQHIVGGKFNVFGKQYPRNVETIGDSGSAARFFYCAKSSRSERNKGLDSYLTVKYIVPKGDILCKDDVMGAARLLEKVTSELGLVSFFTDGSGASITALCRKDSLSTILTETNRIIELKTLQSLMLSPINESIVGVNCEKVNGGNLAENAGSSGPSPKTITQENQAGLVRGAKLVASQMLCKISVAASWTPSTNIHSTVKPIALMRYLCRLITPPQGIVLDPFAGSGSTGIAAKLEGFDFIGIERDAEYCRIAEARIESWKPDEQEILLL